MRHAQRWIARTVALVVAIALGAASVGADCPPERDAPKVIFVGQATRQFDTSLAETLSTDVFSHLVSGTPGVNFYNKTHVQLVLGRNATLQQLGELDAIGELAGALGSQFQILVTFDETRIGNPVVVTRIMQASLTNTQRATIIRRFQTRLPNNDNLLFGAIDAVRLQLMNDLRCVLLGERARPVVPLLVIDGSPGEVSPGGQVHVNATLTDSSSGQRQGGKQLALHLWEGRVLVSTAHYMTNDSGVVSADMNGGSEPGPHSVSVAFYDALGRTTPSNPAEIHYTVRNPTGDLQARAPEPALHLGAGETLSASVTHNGSPVAGTTVSFAAEGGGTVATPSATTDANGNATTQYVAPSTNAVVDVTVTAPAPPTKGPKASAANLTASLTLVVDGGVTLNLNALDTVAGATSDVNADLVVGGTAIPGTNVTYTLSGAGALSAASAPTNDAGRASVLWLAPSGTSTADITAAAVVDGQRYTKTVTVHGRPDGPMRVKVIPRFRDDVPTYRTFADVGQGGPMRTCNYAEANLGGVYNCDNKPADAGYGTTPASPPVTLRAELDTLFFAEVKVTQPDPKVLVLDATMSGPGEKGACDDWACLEFKFASAGVLTVDRDSSSMTGQYGARLLRPKHGLTFTNVTDDSKEVIDGPEYWVAGSVAVPASGTIDVASPETLQLFVCCGGGGQPDPNMPNGKIRFTFTFRPR